MPKPVRPPVPHPSGARPPQLPRKAIPEHVAIVMDGNGRWAKARNLPRTEGHARGEDSLFDVIETVDPRGLSPQHLTRMVVGADIDEYGCKPSTGYSWCESKKKCIRAWEESCDPQEEIARALADKHQWNIDDIIVTVSKSDAKFARGSVRDKSSEVGGGMFLAVKIDNQWEIAFDGNGAPDCTLLKANYSIPQDFLLGICD